jgi:hypothetical protein
MFFNKNIRFITLLPIIFSVIIVIIIGYFRLINLFSYYDKSLRYCEHLIAGIIMPYMFHKVGNDSVNFSCVVYAFGSFVWEFCQYFQRGYFQFDQFCYDLIGTAIIFLLFLLFDFKDKELISPDI